ncbi:methyltransferase [Shewanella sp. WXL01]|uniref:methyltransferase n=1 Tax=Shewanella sp. WXL01 TaxID=2709721 RepID=UPI0014383E35|nr:methyltransferase [Shewanella sp. WXL01]NKF50341.1 methyltransferase [Shewanella sp. WXL01]
MTASHFQQSLTELNEVLARFACLWQVQAFSAKRLPWQSEFPTLAKQVRQLADDDIDELDVDQVALVEFFLPALAQDVALTKAEQLALSKLLVQGAAANGDDNSLYAFADSVPINSAPVDNAPSVNEGVVAINGSELSHFSAGIKGRKWQQITRFASEVTAGRYYLQTKQKVHPQTNLQASQLPSSSAQVESMFEWCAGKGHLGRLLAKITDKPVHSLEWQAQLCEQGQAFADKWQLPQTFSCADVFALDANPLKAKQHAVALHACGDLHVELLHHAVDANTQAVSISPCCYHLIRNANYQPLSAIAKQAKFILSKHDLQLPLQQSVIANPKQQQLRHQEIAWRLAFDSLQRDARDCDEYLPIPSVKRSQLSGEFSDFCLWAAKVKSVALPERVDWQHYLKLGLQRQRLTRRIDLIAHLFRKALEQYLVLDRCCYMEEHGYQVTVSHFCSEQITPRNTLIQAQKMSC